MHGHASTYTPRTAHAQMGDGLGCPSGPLQQCAALCLTVSCVSQVLLETRQAPAATVSSISSSSCVFMHGYMMVHACCCKLYMTVHTRDMQHTQ